MLVVDDAELAGTTLLRILDRGGCEGRWVGTAADARDVAEEWRPDVVLVDRNLPDGDGLALAVTLRELVPDARLVMMSGDQLSDEDVAGLDGYLMKPASARAVLDALGS